MPLRDRGRVDSCKRCAVCETGGGFASASAVPLREKGGFESASAVRCRQEGLIRDSAIPSAVSRIGSSVWATLRLSRLRPPVCGSPYAALPSAVSRLRPPVAASVCGLRLRLSSAEGEGFARARDLRRERWGGCVMPRPVREEGAGWRARAAFVDAAPSGRTAAKHAAAVSCENRLGRSGGTCGRHLRVR